MRYCERTKKMSAFLLGTCVLFFFLTVFSFFKGNVLELFSHGYENEPLGTLLFLGSFVIFLVTLIVGIALRCVSKDLAEEFSLIENSRIQK